MSAVGHGQVKIPARWTAAVSAGVRGWEQHCAQDRGGGAPAALLGELFYGRAPDRSVFEPWGLSAAHLTGKLKSLMEHHTSALTGPFGEHRDALLRTNSAATMGGHAQTWAWY